jgi:hypothetical protein
VPTDISAVVHPPRLKRSRVFKLTALLGNSRAPGT